MESSNGNGEETRRADKNGVEKFSLKEPVEQVGNLVAVHNLNEAKLKGNFELGGMENVFEIEDVNVLYALNTKKEPAALKRPGLGVETDNPATGSVLSIADFLNNVKNHFPDVLSNDILAHYGLSRPKSTIRMYWSIYAITLSK